jgi:hypothetical protein
LTQFRQTVPGQWSDVLEKVSVELAAAVQQRTSPRCVALC